MNRLFAYRSLISWGPVNARNCYSCKTGIVQWVFWKKYHESKEVQGAMF